MAHGCRALWGRRSKYLSTFMKKIVITIVAKLPISDVGGERSMAMPSKRM